MNKVIVIAATIGACAAGSLAAQQPSYTRDVPVALAREAKVSEAAAVAVAKSVLPKGEIASLELEREGGRLIYSMDVKTAGKSGIDEVNVDATTGKMVGKVQHENAAAEKAEAKAEVKADAKARKKP